MVCLAMVTQDSITKFQTHGLGRKFANLIKLPITYSKARFLASDEFYLADLSHSPNTQYLVSDTNRENVDRWWDEISSRDSWKKVVDLQKGA
ncbi:glutathione s-transferase f11 [Quercus suber]|uniref:glutathione transferase n=1 Tax=Quercus suber TaxID=58331 RepID=A0AAW0JGD5_QUESU